MMISCAATGVQKEVGLCKGGTVKLPPGWKSFGDEYYSPSAWKDRFVLRTIRVPVASIDLPVNSPDRLQAAWSELRTALQTSWRQATEASNWMITELAKADAVPLEEGPKGPRLPKMPPNAPLLRHLYHEGRRQWPDIDSQSFCSLRQRVVAKYREIRFDLRCRAAVALPTFRYPTPLPIPAKDAKYELSEGRVVLRVRIAGKSFRLRLRSGQPFRRQRTIIENLIASKLPHGELTLYEQIVGDAHYNGGCDRLTGRPTRLIVATAVWLRKTSPVNSGRSCRVVTGPDHLWQVFSEGDDCPWNLNEDQIPRWTAAYYRQLQRLREDCKLDRRTRHPDDLARRRQELRLKFANRIRNACHQASALLLGFCRRNRIHRVEYDDSNKSWQRKFPWYDLRQLCKEKCEAAGITFVHRSADP